MKKNIRIVTACFLLVLLFFVLTDPVNVFSSIPSDAETIILPKNDSDSQKALVTQDVDSPAVPSGLTIPDSIVSLSYGYVIVVDKKYQKIYVFHKADTFTKVFEAPCSTGKKPGDKQAEGDARTPNGIFFTTKVLRNPGPPEMFGSLAFPLDYPTLADQRAGKGGTNIWIHGTTQTLIPYQSNGCVVLRDADLKRLANFIHLNRTPVIISESINWVPPSYAAPEKNGLKQILSKWNTAFVEKDIKTIDSLYMEGAEIKGKKREELHNKIRNMKYINKHFALYPRDISILQEKDNAVIIFDQVFDVNEDNSFRGFYNKLVLERMNGAWYVVDDASTPVSTSGEYAAASKNMQNEIRNVVNTWLRSWESGDMKTYRNSYAPHFRSRNMDLDAWVAHKENVRQKSRSIRIRIENLQISGSGDSATTSFTQYYSSSIFRSKGKKTLKMEKIKNEWRITEEIM